MDIHLRRVALQPVSRPCVDGTAARHVTESARRAAHDRPRKAEDGSQSTGPNSDPVQAEALAGGTRFRPAPNRTRHRTRAASNSRANQCRPAVVGELDVLDVSTSYAGASIVAFSAGERVFGHGKDMACYAPLVCRNV